MTIDEAIKKLEDSLTPLASEEMPPYAQACKLGLEALKREVLRRKDPNFVHLGFLPGETEE